MKDIRKFVEKNITKFTRAKLFDLRGTWLTAGQVAEELHRREMLAKKAKKKYIERLKNESI